MSSSTIPSVFQRPDIGDAYQETFDALGRAYWDASKIEDKDLIHGTQEAIGDIITAIDEQDLANNTAVFIQLMPKIEAVNSALTTIQSQISNITRNINTASTVLSAISKILSLTTSLT